jgi:SH3-like domain-containing protein
MSSPSRSGLSAAVLCLALSPCAALALDFRAVASDAAVLYDGPSARSSKLFVVNKGYPLEILVAVESWVKVRDATGAFSWIEAKQLTDKRTVMVRVPVVDVRAKPDDGAPVAFQAQQNVILDFVSVNGAWVQVRHRDGGTGYVRAQYVWGA